jgi:hypothetical protein
MNSIDNGLLLCVKHRIQFDAHLFFIHPDVGDYMLFSHSCAQLTDPIDPYCHLFPSSHQVYQWIDHNAAVVEWQYASSAPP